MKEGPAEDAQNQQDELQRAKQKQPWRIANTDKSQQRWKYRISRLKRGSDVSDEYPDE